MAAGILLEHGAELSDKDNVGATPLHMASRKGRGTMVRLLLQLGANEQIKTCHPFLEMADGSTRIPAGSTPEDVATARSHLEVAGMLRAVAVRRSQCVAFAMGQLERLGAGSRVRWLDVGVVRLILEAGGLLPEEGSVVGDEGDEGEDDELEAAGGDAGEGEEDEEDEEEFEDEEDEDGGDAHAGGEDADDAEEFEDEEDEEGGEDEDEDEE